MELVTDAEEVEGVAADCGASGEEIFIQRSIHCFQRSASLSVPINVKGKGQDVIVSIVC